MKYIMFNTSAGKVPIIFSSLIKHGDVADALIPILKRTILDDEVKPVSAGFYDQVTGQVSGDSVSLKLKSDTTDEAMIRKHLK